MQRIATSRAHAAIPRSSTKDLSKIKTRKQNRDCTPSGLRKVVAIDTEAEDGNIFLIADSNGRTLEHPDINFDSVAKFLLRYDEGYWVFFYNLDYDVGSMIKMLPAPLLKKQYLQQRELYFHYNGTTLHYIPKKKFVLRRGKHTVSCYDIMQYYDNKKLQVAYTENIKKPLPPEYAETKEKRAQFTLPYFLHNKKRLRQYCIDDCVLTKELAENWLDTFYKQFGFYVRNWISSGYLAEKVLIANGIKLPYFNDVPHGVQELAWQSFYGGRFELIKRGHIGRCYLYDINSAYPYALAAMPDITEGRWITDSQTIEPQAALGFFHIRAHVDDSVKIAPFPFRTKDNRIIYPSGDFETYVTLEELRAAGSDPRINYHILKSCQFVSKKNCGHPFRRFIEEQYYKRLELKAKGDPLERAIKIVLNSIYGKTAQRVNNRMGNIFNPVIASYITGFTRAQLYRFTVENGLERDVVAFATDSIATAQEIPGLNSARLGEMKLDKHAGDVIFLSNGFYCFNGKWKQRGIGYDHERKAEIQHLDTHIGEDGQPYIMVETTRTTHIKSGILYDKIKNVGKIERYKKKIALNSDKKRFWDSDLESLKDKKYCDSLPLNATLVADKIAKRDDITWQVEQGEDDLYEPESEL